MSDFQLERVPEWSSILSNYMTVSTKKEFQWGSFDCALNAADAILLITGVDLAAQFRGQYSDEAGAYAALTAHGYQDMLDCARQNLPPHDSVFQAHSGDLGAFEHNGHQIVGLIYQSRVFSPSPGIRGMSSVSLRRVHTAFKVGNV